MSQTDRFRQFLEGRAAMVETHLFTASKGQLPILQSQIVAGHKARGLAKKVYWLRQGARTLSNIAAGVTACARGCDACCHVPVMLLSSEAEVIGREIGIPPNEVPLELRNTAAPTWRGKGHACPFLKAGECSIYESRPLACRQLFNLDADAYLCQHEETAAMVPYMDTKQYMVHATAMLASPPSVYLAELRDFFRKAA